MATILIYLFWFAGLAMVAFIWTFIENGIERLKNDSKKRRAF